MNLLDLLAHQPIIIDYLDPETQDTDTNPNIVSAADGYLGPVGKPILPKVRGKSAAKQ